MIKSFRTRDLERFFHNGSVPNYKNIASPLARKLRLLNTSENLNDLRVPPRNNLEKLQSDKEGQYSIRVNDRLRLCFVFKDGNVYELELVDYHKG
jgi:proteic killer suppression protein